MTIGNTEGVVTKPPGAMKDGFYRAANCSSFNESYHGMVWFQCSDGKVSADTRGCLTKTDDEECESLKKNLERAYAKAYVELARLIDEYEQLCSSTEEEEALQKKYDDEKKPLQDANTDLSDRIADNSKDLKDLKPQLDDGMKAEAKLRAHIADLSNRCNRLNASESSLDDVRKAIHALEACPGLARPEFHIPTWVGNWTTFKLENTKTDAQNDAAMNESCHQAFGEDARAAEIGEIEASSIAGMPGTNTAGMSLTGMCPKCEGHADSETGTTNKEGHSRVCWFENRTLNVGNRSDCSEHDKAVLCVVLRDVRRSEWVNGNDTNGSG